MRCEKYQDGTIRYYNYRDNLHREDGPAVIYPSGTKLWYFNNKKHREDGPAIEYPDGSGSWYFNDQRHRLDGPAIVRSDGTKEYWINGKGYLEEEYRMIIFTLGN